MRNVRRGVLACGVAVLSACAGGGVRGESAQAVSGEAGSVAYGGSKMSVSASRRYGAWVSSRIGGGGYVQGVAEAASDPSRWYAWVDMAGVYRSDDGGTSWRMMHAGLPPVNNGYDVRGLLVDPRDKDRLLLAVGNPGRVFGIMRSRDGGVTYEVVQKAAFWGNGNYYRAAGQVLVRHPTNPDVLLAGGVGDGMYLSRDGGDTWERRGQGVVEGHYVADIVFDRTEPKRIWVCTAPHEATSGGKRVVYEPAFFRSEDGGETWSKLPGRSPTEMVQSRSNPKRLLGIMSRGSEMSKVDGSVVESMDGGVTWVDRSEGLRTKPDDVGNMISPFRYRALAAGPDFVVVGACDGTVYRLDGDESVWREVVREKIHSGDWWRMREGRPGFGWALGAITINARDPNFWTMTDWYAIWHTRDAGKNWHLAVEGYEPTVTFVIVPSPDGKTIHLVMADNGHFVSTDGGENFKRGSLGLPSQTKDIDVCRADGSRMYAVAGASHTGGKWTSNQPYASLDAGKTWAELPLAGLPDMKDRICTTITVDPKNPERVLLGVSGKVGDGEGGPYLSTDGGKTWRWHGAGMKAGEGYYADSFWGASRQIRSASDGTLYTLGSASRVTYRLDPGASTWTAMADAGGRVTGLEVHPGEPATLLATVAGVGLIKSQDRGATWKTVRGGNVTGPAFDPRDPRRIAVFTPDNGAGMLLSRDSGETWTMLDPSIPMRSTLRPVFAGGRILTTTPGSGVFFTDVE